MTIRNVLLTGASGLLGRTLASLLADRYELACFDTTDPGSELACVIGDLRDSQVVAEACQGQDAVVHVAALHGTAWDEAGDDVGFAVNVVGTKNVLEGACGAGVKRVVFTSSIWATGPPPAKAPYLPIDEELPREPIELYGLTKKLGESLCAYYSTTHGLGAICLRAGAILPADAPPARRVDLLAGGVDVRDLAQAHLLALQAPDDMRNETLIIVADSPLSKVAPEEYQADPIGAIDKHIPGLADAVAGGKLDVPHFDEWHTIGKAERMLGYRPSHNFDLRAW